MAEEKKEQETVEETVEETAEETVEETVEEAVEEVAESETVDKAEYASLYDKYLRLVAEFDNFKKRTQKEKDEIYSIAKIDVVKSSTKKLVQQGITKPIFNQADAISSAMLMAKENSVVPEEQVLDAVVPIENINLSANVSVSDVMAIAAESKTKEKGATKRVLDLCKK